MILGPIREPSAGPSAAQDEKPRGSSCFGKHQRNGSFSKTMSKTTLLNKIRTAMHKQGEIRKLNIDPNG